MGSVPFALTYDEAIKTGDYEVFPEDRKQELRKSTKMININIDCADPANFKKVCAQYTDASGSPVYSYCDERGTCARLFLRKIR